MSGAVSMMAARVGFDSVRSMMGRVDDWTSCKAAASRLGVRSQLVRAENIAREGTCESRSERRVLPFALRRKVSYELFHVDPPTKACQLPKNRERASAQFFALERA